MISGHLLVRIKLSSSQAELLSAHELVHARGPISVLMKDFFLFSLMLHSCIESSSGDQILAWHFWCAWNQSRLLCTPLPTWIFLGLRTLMKSHWELVLNSIGDSHCVDGTGHETKKLRALDLLKLYSRFSSISRNSGSNIRQISMVLRSPLTLRHNTNVNTDRRGTEARISVPPESHSTPTSSSTINYRSWWLEWGIRNRFSVTLERDIMSTAWLPGLKFHFSRDHCRGWRTKCIRFGRCETFE